MTPQEYAVQAKQTESVVSSVSVDLQLFNTVSSIAYSAIDVLDQIKKNMFYGKPVNLTQLQANLANIQTQTASNIPTALVNVVKGLNVKTSPNVDTRVVHSLLGLVTESGELLQLLTNVLNQVGEFDVVNFGEELGDLDWYKAIGLDATGLTQEQVYDANIQKLQKKRYKSGSFDANAAINRDVVEERIDLESSLKIDSTASDSVTTNSQPISVGVDGTNWNNSVSPDSVGDGAATTNSQPISVGVDATNWGPNAVSPDPVVTDDVATTSSQPSSIAVDATNWNKAVSPTPVVTDEPIGESVNKKSKSKSVK